MSLCYVIDTSYLDELFKVDNKFEEAASQLVKQKFSVAFKANADFVVPVPVLFELANHIAQIGHAENRRNLSNRLHSTVKQSLEDDTPWHITPCNNNVLFDNLSDALLKSTTIFATQFAAQQIGLTDALVALSASSYKLKYPYRKVHIWTRDHDLKAHEPDNENLPFI